MCPPVPIIRLSNSSLPVVPAKAGTHMWTAPRLQELLQARAIGSLAIICPACFCGRRRPLAQMGSATRGPNILAMSSTNGSHGVSRVLGSIDHTIYIPASFPAFAAGDAHAPLKLVKGFVHQAGLVMS